MKNKITLFTLALVFLLLASPNTNAQLVANYDFSERLNKAFRVGSKIYAAHRDSGLFVYDIHSQELDIYRKSNSILENIPIDRFFLDEQQHLWFSQYVNNPGYEMGIFEFDGTTLVEHDNSYFSIPGNFMSLATIGPDDEFFINNRDSLYRWKAGVLENWGAKMYAPFGSSCVKQGDVLYSYVWQDKLSVITNSSRTIVDIPSLCPKFSRNEAGGIYIGTTRFQTYQNGSIITLPPPYPLSSDLINPSYSVTLGGNNYWCKAFYQGVDHLVNYQNNDYKYFVRINQLHLSSEQLNDITGDEFDNLVITTNNGVSLFNRTGLAGLSDPKIDQAQLNLFPNPCSEEFSINSNVNMLDIQIFDVLGHQVILEVIDSKGHQVNVRSLPMGYYQVQIRMDDGEVIHRKLLVKR